MILVTVTSPYRYRVQYIKESHRKRLKIGNFDTGKRALYYNVELYKTHIAAFNHINFGVIYGKCLTDHAKRTERIRNTNQLYGSVTGKDIAITEKPGNKPLPNSGVISGTLWESV